MDKQEASISVVMPVYNGEAFIGRTLNNLFSQTSLPDELIIVDDGSNDATVSLIRQYTEEHPEAKKIIKLFCQENKGAGAARNKALSEATSDWIAFFDSDDIWDAKKLDVIRTAIRTNPEATIITHNEYEIHENKPEEKQYIPLNEKYNSNEDLFVQLYRGNFFSTSCMVVKRDLVTEAGGFDESLRSAQDYDLWIRCARNGRVVFLPDALAIYVVRATNITRNTYRRYKCEMRICRKYADELRKTVGKKEADRIIRSRIFQIHKYEAYLSLVNKQIGSFFRIGVHLPSELLKH